MSQISQENINAGVSFLIKLQGEACNFIKKETLAQLFSCEFCEISKNIFLQNTSGDCFYSMIKTNKFPSTKISWCMFYLLEPPCNWQKVANT